MWFGVEYIHAPMLLACGKHEKMDANIWKLSAKERVKIKAKDFEGRSYERKPNLMSLCIASKGFFYI